jgi:hypothetical protein
VRIDVCRLLWYFCVLIKLSLVFLSQSCVFVRVMCAVFCGAPVCCLSSRSSFLSLIECLLHTATATPTARALLQPIKARHPNISYADLYIFAACVCLDGAFLVEAKPSFRVPCYFSTFTARTQHHTHTHPLLILSFAISFAAEMGLKVPFKAGRTDKTAAQCGYSIARVTVSGGAPAPLRRVCPLRSPSMIPCTNISLRRRHRNAGRPPAGR